MAEEAAGACHSVYDSATYRACLRPRFSPDSPKPDP